MVKTKYALISIPGYDTIWDGKKWKVINKKGEQEVKVTSKKVTEKILTTKKRGLYNKRFKVNDFVKVTGYSTSIDIETGESGDYKNCIGRVIGIHAYNEIVYIVHMFVGSKYKQVVAPFSSYNLTRVK
jgi:hypothetical protein